MRAWPQSRTAALGAAAALLAATGAIFGTVLAGRASGTVEDPRQVAEGARIYAQHCATCHGVRLEGQSGWRSPGRDGLLPAPPHDAGGHTWQHSDAQLFDLIAHSMESVAPPGYRTAMPAFADALSAGQIRAVIAFMKAQWPPGIRAYQAAQNPGGPPLSGLPGDWSFPPTCALTVSRGSAPGVAAAAE